MSDDQDQDEVTPIERPIPRDSRGLDRWRKRDGEAPHPLDQRLTEVERTLTRTRRWAMAAVGALGANVGSWIGGYLDRRDKQAGDRVRIDTLEREVTRLGAELRDVHLLLERRSFLQSHADAGAVPALTVPATSSKGLLP